MEDIIKDIRGRLRRAMDGVTSGIMRTHGIIYKLNFGVSLPKMKEIAALYQPDFRLAEELWAQDVREMKIMATVLYPPQAFTPEKALQWAEGIKYQEIAEQYCINLLQRLSFAPELAAAWVKNDKGFVAVIGFLLYARLFAGGYDLPESQEQLFIREAKKAMENGSLQTAQAAVRALKRYGRQDRAQADSVLEAIAGYKDAHAPEKQEFYDALKFEFDTCF